MMASLTIEHISMSHLFRAPTILSAVPNKYMRSAD
jgi:hypothetical protein